MGNWQPYNAHFSSLTATEHDPYLCNALINSGHWYKEDNRQWLVPGCSTVQHDRGAIDFCTNNRKREIVIVGDLYQQGLYWALAERLGYGSKWPSFESKDQSFDQDHVQLRYFYDPFLNGSGLLSRIEPYRFAKEDRPMLMVVGAADYAMSPNERKAYVSTVTGLASTAYGVGARNSLGSSISSTNGPGDLLLFMPPHKPSPFRADHAVHDGKLELHDELDDRLRELSNDNVLDVLWSFATMMEGRRDLYRDDDPFVNPEVWHRRVDILLNLRCNSKRASTGAFPNLATCCSNWRRANMVQTTFLVVSSALLPAVILVDLKFKFLSETARPVVRAFGSFAAIITLQYISDRTHIFKQVARTRLNTFNLFAMIGMAGVFGILKIRRSKGPARRPVQSIIKPPSLPFLPRDQTDEWKGWMQLLILIYHYNAAFWYDEFWQIIRICIASYLFQTGFGHTVYFLTKRDFSLSRVVNVMVRTNILPCTLAYIMRTNWLLYYYM